MRPSDAKYGSILVTLADTCHVQRKGAAQMGSYEELAISKMRTIVQNAGGYWSSATEKTMMEMIDAITQAVIARLTGDSDEARALRESLKQ